MIGLISAVVLAFIVWASLPASQKESIFRPGKATFLNEQNKHFTEEELVYRNFFVPPCRGIKDPHKQYELARDLEPSHREVEMANIVGDAVCVGDETFALEVFAKLTALDQRDRAAKQVAAFYISKNRFADANRWAAFLSNQQDRDWWIRRSLELSQQNNPHSKLA